MADIKVKLVKSLIGSTKPQIATAHALGLYKIGDASVQPNIRISPAPTTTRFRSAMSRRKR